MVRTKDVVMNLRFKEDKDVNILRLLDGDNQLISLNKNIEDEDEDEDENILHFGGELNGYYELDIQPDIFDSDSILTEEHSLHILNFYPSTIPEKLHFTTSNTIDIESYIEVVGEADYLKIEVTYLKDLSIWAHPFSVMEFCSYFIKNFTHDEYFAKSEDYIGIDISLEVSRNKKELKIINIIEAINDLFYKSQKDTIKALTNSKSKNLFITIFDFPSDYANICSQYLIWFGEFLKNLDIEADVHTEPRNGQTALIVSPKDNPELLDEIKKLFYQYLALPYAELLPASKQTPQEMYAYQSAMNQIDNLKNQIQMKDTMLQLQQATNSVLIEKLELQANKPLLLESLKDEKKYEFFGGLISIPAKQDIGKNKNITLNFEKLFSNKKD